MAGLPNFAPQWLKSISVTPRAREHDPQEKTGMCFVRILSRVSLSDGHPTGMIWSAVAFRIRYVASPVRSKKQALQRRWSFWASDAAWRHVRRTGTGRVPNCALENSILTLKVMDRSLLGVESPQVTPMEKPVRQHIAELQLRVQQLSREIMQNRKTREERNRVEAELRVAQQALTHYQQAIKLEVQLQRGATATGQ